MQFSENQFWRHPSSNVQFSPQPNLRSLQSKGESIANYYICILYNIFIVAFWSNKHYRLKNCKIFIRNFEACVINASDFHNSADRLRFDLPTTEFTMNLNRNNQAVLATDLGDVLLDLSVVLRYSIVYEALIMSHFE